MFVYVRRLNRRRWIFVNFSGKNDVRVLYTKRKHKR